ncbi:hypothetical protein [uncultured Corynebacterium sp.]|uniref:hypothetical protein n=1 Tax=uncultured Corynebacterium sp. TaxID=159447 RepID=UPI0025FC18D7|nr:hypothetical protein [uncultured Corynebacterium sp.]
MAPRKGGVRRALLSLLLILPLIAGAGYLAWSGTGLSAAWTADGEEAGRAPEPVPGIDVGQVQDARRALGEAGTQAGFLEAGFGQARDGVGELKDGGTELVEGTGEVRQGAADLAAGMTDLQAGTGQLGQGAREIADGAGAIADSVGLLNVAVGQVETALGPAKESLRAAGGPDAEGAIADLEALERQLGLVDFTAVAGEADRFRRGADDLSYQLNTPGAEYHDGIYDATAGAGALRDGTAELDDGARRLDEGLVELDDGSGRLDDMATTTADKIREAQRTMPVPTGDQLAAAGLGGGPGAGDGSGDDAGGENAAADATLAPTLAFMVSALVMLAASALWLVAAPGRGDVVKRKVTVRAMAAMIAGIVAIGAVVLFIMADGMDLLRGVTSVIVLTLAALAATAVARAVMVVFGVTWGRVVILAGMVLQVGVIGWVWRTAASTTAGDVEPSSVWGVVAALLPLHHPTAALTALGNAGSTVMWGTSAGVLLALVVIGALTERFGGGRRAAFAAAGGAGGVGGAAVAATGGSRASNAKREAGQEPELKPVPAPEPTPETQPNPEPEPATEEFHRVTAPDGDTNIVETNGAGTNGVDADGGEDEGETGNGGVVKH